MISPRYVSRTGHLSELGINVSHGQKLLSKPNLIDVQCSTVP